jgi:dihydrofolate synthase/folylpolyglutamate synthase
MQDTILLGLSRTIEVLARLDNPHKKLPPIIHIAGTNGKGSTISFVREILTQNKYSVHCYTSPHLINLNERIVLAGEEISDKFLKECLESVKTKALRHPKICITEFEIITIAGFLAFSKVMADVLLLEVGMGGRLDATNVIDENLASIITPISFDHEEFLGKTLAKIASEKSGIFKKNSKIIIGKQKKSALLALENQAHKLNLEVKIFNRDFFAKKNKNGFLFDGFGRKFLLDFPNLIGDHQIDNASTAIACLLAQDKFPIDVNTFKFAIKNTFWKARLQKINDGKLFEILPKNCELFLDGSHNLQGADTVNSFLQKQKNKKKIVIFSMLKDKNCEGFLKKIKGEIDHLIILPIASESRAYDKNEILKIAKNLKIKNIKTNEDFFSAFQFIRYNISCDEQALVLITGSLYFAGEFLKENCGTSEQNMSGANHS